jgi:hypothetical protein
MLYADDWDNVGDMIIVLIRVSDNYDNKMMLTTRIRDGN